MKLKEKGNVEGLTKIVVEESQNYISMSARNNEWRYARWATDEGVPMRVRIERDGAQGKRQKIN